MPYPIFNRFKRNGLIQRLSTINDYLRFCLSRLNEADVCFGHGTDNSWDEALQLVLHSLHLSSDINSSLLNASLSNEERHLLLQRIEKRIDDRIPTAYLLGEAWFMGIPFNVDERVLIPRSPIAEVIAHGFTPWIQPENIRRVLDLCCGSGCIGIATALLFERVSVDLVDISGAALEVAESNIRRHNVMSRVTTQKSDLFGGLSDKYDLILANPPYVDSRDLAEMPAEYRKEPLLGLEAGEDGLDIARRILKHARSYLNDGGVLVVEVGNSWQALEAFYESVPFTWIEFENGGGGVFVLTAQELDRYQSVFDHHCS